MPEADDDGVSGTLEAMEIEVLGERLGRDGTSSIVMSQASVKRAAVCLLVIAVVLAAVGFSMKDEVNWEQRTLDTQSARLAAQRGTLVRKQAMDFVDRGAKQAKLLKVLTVMQAELSREARGMDRLGQLEGEFQGDIDRHHAQIDALVEKMKGNPEVVKYLKSELGKAAHKLHANAHGLVLGLGRSIAIERANAEGWLTTATHNVVTELDKEIAQRGATPALVKGAVSSLGAAAARPSQDERDLRIMVRNFERNMRAVPGGVRLGPFGLAGAEKVLRAVDNMGRTGPLAGHEKWPALQAEMARIAKGAGFAKPRKASAVEAFRLLLRAARFNADGGRARAALEPALARWRAHSLSDVRMLALIEQQVEKRAVPADWLHNGESMAQQKAMLHLDSRDHAAKKADDIEGETAEQERGDDPSETRKKAEEDLQRFGIEEELEQGF